MKTAAMTTKSNVFQPSLKKSWGRLPKAVMRIVSSTRKMPRKTSSSVFRSVPALSSMLSYVCRPRVTALATITPTMKSWNRLEPATRLQAVGIVPIGRGIVSGA
jgi:hypothetical protein